MMKLSKINSKKGIWTDMKGAIILVVLVLILIAISPKLLTLAKQAFGITTCPENQCKSTCGPGEETLYSKICKEESQVCCLGKNSKIDDSNTNPTLPSTSSKIILNLMSSSKNEDLGVINAGDVSVEVSGLQYSKCTAYFLKYDSESLWSNTVSTGRQDISIKNKETCESNLGTKKLDAGFYDIDLIYYDGDEIKGSYKGKFQAK